MNQFKERVEVLGGGIVELPAAKISVLNELDDRRDSIGQAVSAAKAKKQGMCDYEVAAGED